MYSTCSHKVIPTLVPALTMYPERSELKKKRELYYDKIMKHYCIENVEYEGHQ